MFTSISWEQGNSAYNEQMQYSLMQNGVYKNNCVLRTMRLFENGHLMCYGLEKSILKEFEISS